MRTLAALITAVLITGCSTSTEGTPQATAGAPATGKKTDDSVVIRARKQVPQALDCRAMVTPNLVGQAIGTPATPKPESSPGFCEFDVVAADGGNGGGIGVTLTSIATGDKGELDGNTMYQDSSGKTLCVVNLAAAQKKFVRVNAVLSNGEKVCDRARTVAKAVMDALPTG